MVNVAQDKDEYIPMNPLPDQDYEVKGRNEMEPHKYSDTKVDTTKIQEQEISNGHEYIDVIEG